jgi:putative endonuclease
VSPHRGREAERRAAHWLEGQGLTLVECNYRCRFGEIDLVMREGTQLVFVEVRMRARPGYGGAAASIDRRKRGKLVRAARHYLTRFPQAPACRFDAVLMDGQGEPQWIRAAFDGE